MYKTYFLLYKDIKHFLLLVRNAIFIVYECVTKMHHYNICFVLGQKGSKGDHGQNCNNTEEIERIEQEISAMQQNNSQLHG